MKESKRIRYVIYGLLMVSLMGMLVIVVYARIWERMQPSQEINGAIVRSIKPYHHGGGDLHWTTRGNRIYIEGEDRPIDFPSKNWDDTVKEGDVVDLVVRKSFPLFKDELDGLSIDDHK